MVAPGNKDGHRRSMSGLKVQETEKWGSDKARQRYGELQYDKTPPPPPKDQSRPQRLGDSSNLQGKNYDNNHREDWVRGFGKGGVESAEGYPCFDRSGSKRR
jgi:hypothetical protein